MSLYGVEPWTRNADAFGVLFGLIGSLAPLGRARRRAARSCACPFTGAARLAPVGGHDRRCWSISIGSTAFDGAKEGALFNDLAQDLQRFFHDLGLSLGARRSSSASSSGWPARSLIVGGDLDARHARDEAAASGPTARALARAFAHTLIPIAAGYLVAHYFSLLAYNGQDLWRLANDPLGNGSDLFGGADAAIDYGVVSATGIWYVQVGALVVGHVAALVLAHDRALELYGSPAQATRSQVVMLVLMVAFTCLGLWLLSAALNA